MSPTHQVHTRWGRSLEKYLTCLAQPSTDPHVEGASFSTSEAKLGIKILCMLARETKKSKQIALTETVTLPMLHATTQLALSTPCDALDYFTIHPGPVVGCFKLVTIAIESGLPSLFSYEYGILAFRFLSAALALLFLDRAVGLQHVSAAGELAKPDPEEIVYGILPFFSAMVQDKMDSWGGPELYDSILGWSGSTADPSLVPILSHKDAAALLSMISQDSTRFLKTFTSIYPISMDGVLFLLWRHVILQ
ncbi:hypothetical protein FRC11_002948, partial [Ceratobasidium sp. 423]